MKEEISEETIIAIATALLFYQEGCSPLGKITYTQRKDLLTFNDEFFLDEEESYE